MSLMSERGLLNEASLAHNTQVYIAALRQYVGFQNR